MRKLTSITICLLLLLVACSNEPSSEEIQEMEEPEDVEFEDREDIIKTDKVEVDVVDDVVEVKIDESVVEQELGAPFETWCNPGETFVFESEEGDITSTLKGVETYKGSEFCKGEQLQTIQSPMGEISISTTYYISEDQKEYWVVTDTMGQKSETHVTI